MAPDLDVSARRVILNPSQIGVVHPTPVPLGTTNEAPARNTVFGRMVFSMSRFLGIFALWWRKLIAFFVSNCRARCGLVKVNEAGILSLGLFPPDWPSIAARVHDAYDLTGDATNVYTACITVWGRGSRGMFGFGFRLGLQLLSPLGTIHRRQMLCPLSLQCLDASGLDESLRTNRGKKRRLIRKNIEPNSIE